MIEIGVKDHIFEYGNLLQKKELKITLPGGRIRVGLLVEKELALPAFTGAIIRAAFLNFIKNHNPLLSDKLHMGNERRPYAISKIWPSGKLRKTKRGEVVLKEGAKIEFFIKLLEQKLLSETATAFLEHKDGTLNILGHELKITEVEMIKPEIDLQQITNKVKIIFQTPTYFASKMHQDPVLFPEPTYFYMNTYQTWNYFNHKLGTINEKELYEWIKRHIVVNDHAIYTARVYIGKRTPIKGFKGWVVYKIKDITLLSWIGLLSHYAEIANVGGNRTAGLGLVKVKWLN